MQLPKLPQQSGHFEVRYLQGKGTGSLYFECPKIDRGRRRSCVPRLSGENGVTPLVLADLNLVKSQP